jgi:hypothetical protein
MAMSAAPGGLKLHARGTRVDVAAEDRGPMMRAAAIALDVWQGTVSAKWVIQKMAPSIGFQIGKPWYFHRREAELWRDEWIAQHRGGAQ